ncbi:aromatase/cyclase [Streptacidiphilus sp. N1-10]|uniref:Aromatase/cyclase n=1 Tax=Streptacidiphilus jeojiensis TaxID=3229225 RepID=A0ABV6XHE3_9ACTN
MSEHVLRNVQHAVDIAAPPQVVHGLLADAVRWPAVFPPTVHVEREPLGEDRELLRIWALAGGEVRAWTSQRRLLKQRLHITFRQTVSAPPVASMSGSWDITPLSDGGSRVILSHRFAAIDDDPEQLRWIEETTDRNSTSELASLRGIAEGLVSDPGTDAGTDPLDRLLFSFEDSVLIQAPPEEVHDFLYRADLWPQRLPHVARVRLTEDRPGEQLLEMDTVSPDGSPHTTVSVRIGLAPHTLAYKQTVLPPAFAAHSGRWTLAPDGDGGTRATSRHTVRLDPVHILALPGVETLEQGREAVRTALGTNSLTTLNRAKELLEGAGASI